MSETPPIPALAQPNPVVAEVGPTGESFLGVVVRRTRYVVAIAVSAAIFLVLAWPLVAPPSNYAGISLLAWAGFGESWSNMHGLIAAAALAGLMVAAVFISMLICHPDSPHTAMYCTLLGLGGLAIRGGTTQMMLDLHQRSDTLGRLFKLLAIECVQWGVIILVAEAATHLLFASLFRNTRWIERLGLPLTALGLFRGALPQAEPVTKAPANRLVDNMMTLGVTAAGAFLMLQIFMQSQAKGQVLFAIFVSFGLAAFAARMVSPRSDTWPFWLAVPVTAAAGYLMAPTSISGMGTTFAPGMVTSVMTRALPIDYISTGIPGAIIGYTMALRWQLHQHLTEHEAGS